MSDDLVPLAYLARAVDKDTHEPWAVDDDFDGYVPVEPYAYRRRPSRREWSVHPHLLPLPDDLESSRVLATHWCDCKRPTALARVLAGSDGRAWALIRPERIPRPARRDGHMVDDDIAAPLHCDANGTPCIQVSSCKPCGQRWLVLIFEDVVELVKVRLVKHGLRVAPDRT